MKTRIAAVVVSILAVAYFGCGAGDEKPPLGGADFVSVIVSTHYYVEPIRIDAVGGEYEWHLRAENRSEYAWTGTLVLKLVTADDLILESHEFPMDHMVEPGEVHEDLKFVSKYNIADRGGQVSKIKVEVNATDYIEPETEPE
ncbi:MAG: hypothetical protein JSW52_05735 [Candidatus Coatesbacteria bacterium]|nr:MAG: hypothetical protein JSW52_05735 [Candidatus Coatesbacteria bacterium]